MDQLEGKAVSRKQWYWKGRQDLQGSS